MSVARCLGVFCALNVWPRAAGVSPAASRAESSLGPEAERSKVAFDPEPTVVDFSGEAEGSMHAFRDLLADHVEQALDGIMQDAGIRWGSWNPKNGTPWYRFKRVGDAGAAGHPHFNGLTATGNFRDDILGAHNVVRERAGIQPLEWSAQLASLASARVQKLANNGCYIQHSPLEDRWQNAGFQYIGENLYKVINMVPTGVDIVDAWYAEVEDYSYGPVGSSCTKALCADRVSPPCTLGHFTQVMWSHSSHLGCALSECPSQAKQTFVAVCQYGPGGNIVGRLPFESYHSATVGLDSQVCTAPDVSPFNLKRRRTLRSAATPAVQRAAPAALGLTMAVLLAEALS